MILKTSLKEKVDIPGWLAVAIGFLGVIVMAQPTADSINIGVLYALLFTVGDPICLINIRFLTHSDHPVTVAFYFGAVISLITGAALPFVWQTPDWQELMILVLLGIGGGVGQLFLTQAYQYAKAVTIAPMIYSGLLWSVLFGYVFWGEVPDFKVILGGALIIGSGLYVTLRVKHV